MSLFFCSANCESSVGQRREGTLERTTRQNVDWLNLKPSFPLPTPVVRSTSSVVHGGSWSSWRRHQSSKSLRGCRSLPGLSPLLEGTHYFWAVSMGAKNESKACLGCVHHLPLSLSCVHLSLSFCLASPLPIPVSWKLPLDQKKSPYSFLHDCAYFPKRVLNVFLLCFCTPYWLFPGCYPCVVHFRAYSDCQSGKNSFRQSETLISFWTHI